MICVVRTVVYISLKKFLRETASDELVGRFGPQISPLP